MKGMFRLMLSASGALAGLALVTASAGAQARGRTEPARVVVEHGNSCNAPGHRDRDCLRRNDWCLDRNHDRRCDRVQLKHRAPVVVRRRAVERSRVPRVVILPRRLDRPNWLGEIILRAGIGGR